MWIKFKWDMFITSFIPLWLSIIINDILTIIFFNDSNSNCVQILSIVIIIILVFSSVWRINSFINERLIKNKHYLSKGKIEKAKKANKLSSEFLLAYILPMIAFDFNSMHDIILFVVYFSVLAYLCIKNDNIYTNIFLEFKGYSIYVCDLTCRILENDYTYRDSIIISKSNLTQEEGNYISYWDFENYIYITSEKEKTNE